MITSAEERTLQGRSRRALVSRAALAKLNPKERRFDPIDALLASAKDRIPELLPVKYTRMKKSPFAFFRGAVSIMAEDLMRLPNSGLHAQLCGDAHLQNLGSFAAPDGNLVFDLNDFDQTIRGPWEWDVKRMAASIVLAGQEIGHNLAGCRDATETFVQSYCRRLGEFSEQPVLEVARHQIHREKRVPAIQAALRQSERARPLDTLIKLTQPDSQGHWRFRDLRPDSWRIGGRKALEIIGSLGAYRNTLAPERRHLFNLFRSLDVGFKVVGTGSVGLRNYVVLCEGNGPQDPLFLQIKQQVASAYVKELPDPVQPHHGRRVARGQRAMQAISDLLLGWTTIGRHHYLVRQLNDRKGSVELKNLGGVGLKSLARVAGELLARGHARSGDARVIYGYCGSGPKIITALRDFACAYAAQSEADYRAFLAAIRIGKIKVAKEAG